jgi:adenylate cyclase
VLNHYGVLTSVEDRTVDWRFQVRGEIAPPLKVIYADVDSLSLDTIGGFPWSRSYHAKVEKALVTEAKVKAVGFDFVFSDAGIAESADVRKIVLGNAEFGTFLKKEPPVVLASGYEGWQFIDVLGKKTERHLPVIASDKRPLEKIEPPEIPSFRANPTQPIFYRPPFTGLIDTLHNGTRSVPAYAPTATRTYFHMSFELARLYWGLPPGSIRPTGDHIELVRPDGTIVASVPLRDRQMLDVNWFTRWYSSHTAHAEFVELYQYAEMLESGDATEKAAAAKYFANPEFKDAVVLVGPVDPLLQDLAPTSLDDRAVPKVGVHGNALMTVVSGRYLRHVPAGAADFVFGRSLPRCPGPFRPAISCAEASSHRGAASG